MARQTALYDEHLKLGAKMVEFAGWDMPVQYPQGLGAEHLACRGKIGLFDVSHMGEVRVRGKGALAYLNGLVTNNVSKIKDYQAQYSVMCYESGGCVDDLIIHRLGEEDFLICVNASNTEKDFAWMKEHAPSDLSVEDVSMQYTQIAVQGRRAEELLQKLTKTQLASIRYYGFSMGEILGKPSLIARTGYTGEDGFEIYVPWDAGPTIWSALLEEGAGFGIQACGLGARDTLRTEMKYPLYGHEISETLNPLEAGLGWVVKLDKPSFIGKTALLQLKDRGLKKTLVGLRSLDRGIPRPGYKVEFEGRPVGFVTSGTMSPCLKVGIAIACVEKELAQLNRKVDVMIRDQRVSHEIVETPFYKRSY